MIPFSISEDFEAWLRYVGVDTSKLDFATVHEWLVVYRSWKALGLW